MPPLVEASAPVRRIEKRQRSNEDERRKNHSHEQEPEPENEELGDGEHPRIDVRA
jgi:hypothetical protein